MTRLTDVLQKHGQEERHSNIEQTGPKTDMPSIYDSYKITEHVIREDLTLARLIIPTGIIKGCHVAVEHSVTPLAMTSEAEKGIYCEADTSHLLLEYRSYTVKLYLCYNAFRMLTRATL